MIRDQIQSLEDGPLKSMFSEMVDNIDMSKLGTCNEAYKTLVYGPASFQLDDTAAGLLILALCGAGYLPETVMMYAKLVRCPLVSATVKIF